MNTSESTKTAAPASASAKDASAVKNGTSDATPAVSQTPNEKTPARKDAAASSSTSVIGKRFRKSFGSRFFWGSVIAHYVVIDALFYKVRFDDGDVDILPAPEVLEDIKMAEKHARDDKAAGSANRKRQARELARTAATVATAPVVVQPESAKSLATLASVDAQQADALLATASTPAAATASTKRKRTDAAEIDATLALANGVDVTVYDQRLYLSIVTTKRVTRVSEFVPRDDGSPGEIEATKRVRPGDIITYINGQSVVGLDSSTVSREIRKATRPVVIRFYRGELKWSSGRRECATPEPRSSSNSVQSTPIQTDQGSASGTASSHTPSLSAPLSASSDAPQANAHPQQQQHQQQQHQQQLVVSSRSDQPLPSTYSSPYVQASQPYASSQARQQSSQSYLTSSAPTYAPPASSMAPSTHPSMQMSARVPPPQYQAPYQSPYPPQYSTVSSAGVPMAMSQPVAHTSTYTAAPPSSSRASMQSLYQQQQQQQQRVMEMRRAALARQMAQHQAEQQWRASAAASQSMHTTSMMRPDSASLSYSNRPNYTTSAGYSHQQQRFEEVTASNSRYLDSLGLQPQSNQRASQSSSSSGTSMLTTNTVAQQETQRPPAQDTNSASGGDQSPLFSESPVALELQGDDDGNETLSEGDDDDAAAAEKELAAVLGLDPATATAASTTEASTTAPAGSATTTTEPSPEAAEEMSFLTPSKTSFVAAMPRASSSTTTTSSALTTPLLSVPPLPNLSQPRVMARTGHFNSVECAIVLIRRQRLLVSLTPLGSFVSIASFLSGPQGESGEIEESGKVCVGDVLVAINGMGLPPSPPVANVAKLLGSMVRPFEIYFHRASWDVLEGSR